MPCRIIDTHIHLFAKANLHDLAWMTEDSLLYGNHRLQEYARDSAGFLVKGVVFVESDRKSSASDWQRPVEEYEYVSRVARCCETQQEGPSDFGHLLVAMVPWAPVIAGKAAMEEYIGSLKRAEPLSFDKIKGFRYLVQDKPQGTMIKSEFVDGLKVLGEKGYAFDLGIDTRSGGIWQLQEAVQLVRSAPEVVYIVSKCESMRE